MKLFHTSDLHLYSSMASRIPSEKIAGRKRELLATFKRMSDAAKAEGVAGIIIAGDLFDRDDITENQAKEAASVIALHPEVEYYYLPGNHERGAFLPAANGLENLHLFGDNATSYRLGNAVIAGAAKLTKNVFETFLFSPSDYNIAVLHGALTDRSSDETVGLSDAAGKNIDYLALGHYHTFTERRIDERGVAVYSGTPEGRGFDEVGEMGFVEIDTDAKTHRFRPFAQRTVHEIAVDVTGLETFQEYDRAVRGALSPIPAKDIVRVLLTGTVKLAYRSHTINGLLETFIDKFYAFSIKDARKPELDKSTFINDPTLKGEFIRSILADEALSDEDRNDIIACGLAALAGEVWEDIE